MIDHFGFVAAVYDRLIGAPNLERMKRLLDLPCDGWLLDAGGGTGRVSAALGPLAGHVAVGDLSMAMLRQAKAKGNLHPLRMQAERMPFDDQSFARVMIIDALHHFANQQKAIGECLRILKPGGRLVIEEPDIDLRAVKLVALAEKLLLMKSRFLSSTEMIRMIGDGGVSAKVVERDRFRVWICAVK
jgi:demethylmenaquinone methyltransferase/2-methoxy-6-polyprenyl-1,4-benzoquinol methylase